MITNAVGVIFAVKSGAPCLPSSSQASVRLQDYVIIFSCPHHVFDFFSSDDLESVHSVSIHVICVINFVT